jgi:hypothetical protein
VVTGSLTEHVSCSPLASFHAAALGEVLPPAQALQSASMLHEACSLACGLVRCMPCYMRLCSMRASQVFMFRLHHTCM